MLLHLQGNMSAQNLLSLRKEILLVNTPKGLSALQNILYIIETTEE
jgi:hypothetical protein